MGSGFESNAVSSSTGLLSPHPLLTAEVSQTQTTPWQPNYGQIGQTIASDQYTGSSTQPTSDTSPLYQSAYSQPTESTSSGTAITYANAYAPSSGSTWRAGYNGVAPAFGQVQQESAGSTSSAPWRAGYNQVAPAFNEGQTTQPGGGGGTVPWQTGYNGGTPAFTGGQSTETTQPTQTTSSTAPWRSPYNGVAPGYYNGQPSGSGSAPYNPNTNPNANGDNPNANGNQPQGPTWNPTPQYSWSTPQPGTTGSTSGDGSTGDSSGIPGYSQGNNFYDPNRPDLNAALVRTVNFPFQMMIGGISGAAFGGPIQWIANKTADSILVSSGATPTTRVLFPENSWARNVFPKSMLDQVEKLPGKIDSARSAALPEDSPLVKGAKWWQDHFDPQHFRNTDLINQHNIQGQAQSKIEGFATANADEITKLKLANPNPDTWSPETVSEMQTLRARQDYFTTENWKVPSTGSELIKQLKGDMSANPGMMSSDELAAFQQRADAIQQKANIVDSQAAEGSFFGKGLATNFIAGAGFVGLTMVADNYLDRLFGNNHQQGLTDSSLTSGLPLVGGMTTSWHSNALLVPMAFAAGDGWGPKAIAERAVLTGAALVGGKILDKVLPTSKAQQFSQLLQPTGIDSLLMGAAFLLPSASTPQRMAMIGGAWLLGRVYNAFEGPAPIDVKNQAYSDMQTDTKDRTANSMDAAIDKFKQLGALDDQSLKLYAADWLRPGRKYENYMSAYRGAAILTTAFGESRMAHGTLIPQTQDTFILGGTNLDVDSQALRAFMIAQLNIKNAEAYTQKNLGQTIDGNQVSSSELQGLQQVNQQIQSQIDTIYGKHDIPAAVQQMEQAYQGNMAGVTRLKMDIQNTVAVNRTSADKQFMGKQFRDLALIDLSVAASLAKKDPQDAYQMLYGDTAQGRDAQLNNGQTQGYDGALDELSVAAQYDPNNPDLPQLQAIANQLKAQLPQAIQSQMANPTYNPLNVNGALDPGTKQ